MSSIQKNKSKRTQSSQDKAKYAIKFVKFEILEKRSRNLLIVNNQELEIKEEEEPRKNSEQSEQKLQHEPSMTEKIKRRSLIMDEFNK